MLTSLNWPAPGRYLVAVSGGADSIALLHVLATSGRYELVSAHFDHGLRADSALDAQLVEETARALGVPSVSQAAHLGQASEAVARQHRYEWLEQARVEAGAAAIVTAHHRDDLVETSVLNLARGSGRHGLAPMHRGPLLRPLLEVSRAQLRAYNAHHRLQWREDPTNADIANPRNFLRHRLLAQAPAGWTDRYAALIGRQATLNAVIDDHLAPLLDQSSWTRRQLRDLTLPEVAELLHAAVRRLDPGAQLDQRLLAELALFAATARPHRRRPIRGRLELAAGRDSISVLSV
jgi:tRNA(Ile)-lysidine synthase